MRLSKTRIRSGTIHSLAWQNDTLIDWIGGGNRFDMRGFRDQIARESRPLYSDVVVSPNGRYAVLYQKFGTQGLILVDGRPLAELRRSDHQADRTPFPICLWTEPCSGHTLMAHCPDDPCQVEIDDLDRGRRLSVGSRHPEQYRHARLSVNPAATRLLSDGWVWTPWDYVGVFDLIHALDDPTHLDDFHDQASHSRDTFYAEESFGCWQSDHRILLAGAETAEAEDEQDPISGRDTRLLPFGIASYDLHQQRYVQSVQLQTHPGILMPVGERHVVSFYDHPKLVCLETGDIVAAWPELPTGEETGLAYQAEPENLPIKALDPANNRFAVVRDDTIHVINIDLEAQKKRDIHTVQDPYLVTIQLAVQL